MILTNYSPIMNEKLKKFFNKTSLILFTLAILIVAAFFVLTSQRSIDLTPLPTKTPDSSSPLIKVYKPTPNQIVKSPIEISGEARGYWFFEASFPIRVYDANNVELGVVAAQAEGEWMTENFVPFKAKLEFKKPTTETGTLVFEKDNPSGLPEHDDRISIPVKFDLAGWPTLPTSSPVKSISPSPASSDCKVTGCSGQICSDEEVITTCEFKEEYTCYKTAKCARQEDGKCAWTPSEELVACLMSAWEKEPPTPQ